MCPLSTFFIFCLSLLISILLLSRILFFCPQTTCWQKNIQQQLIFVHCLWKVLITVTSSNSVWLLLFSIIAYPCTLLSRMTQYSWFFVVDRKCSFNIQSGHDVRKCATAFDTIYILILIFISHSEPSGFAGRVRYYSAAAIIFWSLVFITTAIECCCLANYYW